MEIGHNPTNFQILGSFAGDEPSIGLEIEASGDEDFYNLRMPEGTAQDLLAAVKEDASFVGGEFITNPASYEYLAENLLDSLRYIRGNGYAATAANGLHIHVSRDRIDANHLYRLQFLLNQRTDAWHQFLRMVFGRGGSHWAATVQEREMSWVDSSSCPAAANLSHVCRNGKFLRLNCLHQKTLEFRQGAGTLRRYRILGRVEAVLALVEFTRVNKKRDFHAMGGAEGEVATFRQFLETERSGCNSNVLRLIREAEAAALAAETAVTD